MSRINRRILMLAAGALAVGAAALFTGCQERVVSARGLGSDQYPIQEPLYEQPGWERAVFGDSSPRRRELITPPPKTEN